MATWWKRFKYSKVHKSLLFALLCLAGILLGNSLFGITVIPDGESYYGTWEYQSSIMNKAGFVRDWIVRYVDEDIFNTDKVTDEEAARYLGIDLSMIEGYNPDKQEQGLEETSEESTVDVMEETVEENNHKEVSFGWDAVTEETVAATEQVPSMETWPEEKAKATLGIIKDRKEYFTKIQANLDTPNIEYFAVNKETGQVVTNRKDYDGTNHLQILEEFKSRDHYVKGNGDSALFYENGTAQADYYGLGSSYYDYYYGEGVDYTDQYEVYVALKDELVPGDSFYTSKLEIDRALAIKEKVYAGLVIGIAIAIVAGLLWLSVVGQEEKKGKVYLNVFDKLPFEVQTMLYIPALFMILIGSAFTLDRVLSKDWLPYGGSPFEIGVIVFNFMWVIAVSLTVLFISSIVKHMKNGSWKQYILIVRLGRWLIMNMTEGTLPFVVIGVILIYLVSSGISILAFLIGYSMMSLIAFMGLVCLNIGVALISIKLVVDYMQLAKGIKKVAAGDLKAKVELKYTLPAMKETANALNHIGDGLESAVTDALRSERFKTELITNVSHDLKTPLTSIISYIDLLKEEHIDNSAAREYIGILDERSNRLKQLVEDLVEASKAATGNVKAELMPTRIDQLVIQSVGEYTDRLEEGHLNIVFNKVEEVTVPIDSRHMCRVIENLLSNVCKYAMPYTRVYIDVYNLQNKACVVIKNISKEQLAIEAEELLERFVRGESSRTTEGSGLGLAIARSLVEVQGGKLGLEVDGDLFKVVIELPY
ncbi:MAG: HAMP domain-containing histidine kinase [Candidatus Niameybacter stercoravium]|nr:HAMP domain-containing histidine kinase [Candidatus Niameybacter stercoravium]